MIPFFRLRVGGAMMFEKPGIEDAEIIAVANRVFFANCRLFIFLSIKHSF